MTFDVRTGRDGRPRDPQALRPRAVDRPQRDQVNPADPRVCRGGRLRGPALRRKAARAADGCPGRKYDVRVVALLRSAAPLELYAHDHVYVRCANKAHSSRTWTMWRSRSRRCISWSGTRTTRRPRALSQRSTGEPVEALGVGHGRRPRDAKKSLRRVRFSARGLRFFYS